MEAMRDLTLSASGERFDLSATDTTVYGRVPKIDFRYLKEAFKEPLNFWGMAGFAVAAAFVQDVTPLAAALAAETVYLATVPASQSIAA